MTERESKNPFSSPLPVSRMLTTTPPQLHHVLPGLLQANVGMVAASGGAGKSTFFLQLAFSIASGGPICGGLFSDVNQDCARMASPGKVVYVAAEESDILLWHRMHAVVRHMFQSDYPHIDEAERLALLNLFEQNLCLFPLLGKPRTLLLDEAHEPTEAFTHLTKACEGARLVLIDPVRQFHRGDENDSWNMTAFVQTLQMLAARTGAAVLVAHHTNRASTLAGSGDAAGAARGSTAMTDGVRWQLNLSRPGPEILKEYGVTGNQNFLRADISKANYLAPYPSQLLRRGLGGALSLVRRTYGAAAGEASAVSRPERTSRRPKGEA